MISENRNPKSIVALVVMGASLGGIEALRVVLGNLNAGFPVPVVVLHRGEESDETLCRMLRRDSALPVSDAEDKTSLDQAQVYLAPPGYHLLVAPGHVALSVDEPVHSARPSIDVLFESAADAYGSGVIGVILTGFSSDGAGGLASIKRAGGLTVVQDPETAEEDTMPNAAISATCVDKILPLSEIASYLNGVVA